MSELSFPRIRVRGDPLERGRQYGEQASERIRQCIEVYKDVFDHYAKWGWKQVTEHAQTYIPAIAAYRERYIDEMCGIAEGASLHFEDVLALNVRTEVMFSAVARAASAQECTAFVALPEATMDGHVLTGQNWDWKPGSADTIVILEAEPDSGTGFVTVVEAGLLAKTGINGAGIGLVTNALISDQDQGTPGVPYHCLLRAILESQTMSEALKAITFQRRASSANYLIAHRDGEAINAEAAPGDYARVYFDLPQRGLLTHANHFSSPRFDLKDVGLWEGAGSLFRGRRLTEWLQHSHGRVDADVAKKALADHFNLPFSICRHVEPQLPTAEQYTTVFSSVMDLNSSTMWLAEGNPCEAEYHRLEYTELLGEAGG
jgi:isopenicillin-N N-acyltransferase-like protein